MGIRQLPSGSFQVRFQLNGASHTATFPTREMAEEAEILMRAGAIAAWRADDADLSVDIDDEAVPRPSRWQPDRETVTASSAEAAAVIDAVFADFDVDQPTRPEGSTADEWLTTGQAAQLAGVSRPTVVAWLTSGRIPFSWRGTHRRIRGSELNSFLNGHSRQA